MKIAYLGPQGSFSHNVALRALPEAVLQDFETITEVIKAFESDQVDGAIVPVENAIEGSVHETLDYLFHQADLEAVAEFMQPIKQQLLVTSLDKPIEKIFSHPQAIAQGKAYINAHYPKAKIEVTASTAYAARYVAEHPDQPFAAIAPDSAAATYGLVTAARDIHELEENFTRFWLLAKKVPHLELPQLGQKLSLALTLPDNLPGALYKAMSVFAWRGIDLTKIESRPLKTVLGEYFFIMDVVYQQPEPIQFALEELASMGIRSKILGKYGVFQMETTGND
ncbi:prephenate dehydratase [Streptococcus rupicaprae]|uniref:Prephenate dehydratase n=1 Tax=Streptococcus rupicaprae TaxID=759619 RepID=A0ABV2FEV4_9STRE